MDDIMKHEYSERFDTLQKNHVKVACYKYEAARVNFGSGRFDALATAELCLGAFKKDHNKEHLLDAANYLMFRYMYPILSPTLLTHTFTPYHIPATIFLIRSTQSLSHSTISAQKIPAIAAISGHYLYIFHEAHITSQYIYLVNFHRIFKYEIGMFRHTDTPQLCCIIISYEINNVLHQSNADNYLAVPFCFYQLQHTIIPYHEAAIFCS